MFHGPALSAFPDPALHNGAAVPEYPDWDSCPGLGFGCLRWRQAGALLACHWRCWVWQMSLGLCLTRSELLSSPGLHEKLLLCFLTCWNWHPEPVQGICSLASGADMCRTSRRFLAVVSTVDSFCKFKQWRGYAKLYPHVTWKSFGNVICREVSGSLICSFCSKRRALWWSARERQAADGLPLDL